MNRQRFLQSSAIAAATLMLTRKGLADDNKNPFSYSYKDIQNNLAIIHTRANGQQESHCGVIALMDGKPYLITNQHFILGTDRISFTSPSGRTIKPRSIEPAGNSDLLRMALSEGSGFELASESSMGEDIAIFGSDQSTDAKNSIFGKINGVGADIIEVTAEFEDSNGGSPVLNQNREVLGLASYSRSSSNHIMKKGTRFDNRTRRFCLRPNGTDWKAVNWKKFNKNFGMAYSVSHVMIDDMITILNSWADGPLETVTFEGAPNKNMATWLQSHNQIVSQAVDTGKGRREFYVKYSESTEKLSTLCEIQARKLRLLLEQRGLTEFISNELDMQAATLEMIADVINRYGASTY